MKYLEGFLSWLQKLDGGYLNRSVWLLVLIISPLLITAIMWGERWSEVKKETAGIWKYIRTGEDK